MDKLLKSKDNYFNAFEKIKQEYDNKNITSEDAIKYLTSIFHSVATIIDNFKNTANANIINEFKELSFDIQEYLHDIKTYQVEGFENITEYAIRRCSTIYVDIIEDENEKGVQND